MRAFRDNKPFDVFTREQLAGDLMPNATVEQKIASAYNRMGRTSAEGGLQPKEYLAKYGAERVRTVSTNWLGTTMGCSECHNHKFDPVLTKDFYAMKAFFADVKETGLVPDFGPDAFAPKMPVYQPGEKERIDALSQRVQGEKSELDRKADALQEERRAWEKEILARANAGNLAWKFPIPTAVSAKSAKLSVQNTEMDENEERAHPLVATTGGAGLIVVGGPNPDNETYTVTLKPGAGVWTSAGYRGGYRSLPFLVEILRAVRIDSLFPKWTRRIRRRGEDPARRRRSSSLTARFRRPRVFPPWRYSTRIRKPVSELSAEQRLLC